MPKNSTNDMLSVMRKRLAMAIGTYSDSREDELDDLRFFAASPDNQWQWPADVLATRGSVQGQTINARPCLTINKLPQHVRQITNDQRQNRPTGKIIPANELADVEVAEILDGIIKHIEYISDADVAYDTACENQVVYGEGYFRILVDYCADDSFDQDIKIGRIRSSFSVYMDPMIQDPCGSDAEWCLITEDLLKDDYERQFPDAKPVSSIEQQGVGDNNLSQWVNQDTVRIAEYFYAEYEEKTLNLYAGGMVAFSDSPEAKQIEAAGLQVTKKRTVSKRNIKWIKTNGYEVLEERDWLGEHIPVVRVVGNEFEVDGQIYLSGIVRNAKDAQRMYNYWVSQEAEMLALAPKAPFIGYGGQFEGYEHQWKTANTNNWPYLEVNTDVTDGNGGMLPLPQRAAPPLPQAGLIQAKMGASDDIKSTTGQYDASLGAEAREVSGRAITARERQTDTGTFHYVDNLSRAIRYGTRQILRLIPKVYDTKRVARIIGLDGSTDYAKIDPTQQEPVKKILDNDTGAVIQKIYNPGIGKYDVCVSTGPSYMTQRQEAVESMQKLLQAAPQLWQVAGDLFVKNMDWPGAEEMAERIKKTIDPKLLDGADDNPELARAKQQIQQMGQEMDQMHQMLQNINKSFESMKLQNEHFESDIKAYDAETKRLAVLAGAASPVEIQAVVRKTIQEMLAQPLMEQEEPAALESGEVHGSMSGGMMPPQGSIIPPGAGPPQNQPTPLQTDNRPQGGFFSPEQG